MNVIAFGLTTPSGSCILISEPSDYISPVFQTSVYLPHCIGKVSDLSPVPWALFHRRLYGRRSSLTRPNMLQWKGGTWSELNRTKVYSISKKLNSAKVGNPLYLNNSHVVRAKPLHSSLHQK